MFLHEKTKLQLQQETLPEGFVLITSGRIQSGDLRWNVYNDCWNLTDVTRSPKHDIIIGDPISNFAGVCRPVAFAAATEIYPPDTEFESPLHKPQYLTLTV